MFNKKLYKEMKEMYKYYGMNDVTFRKGTNSNYVDVRYRGEYLICILCDELTTEDDFRAKVTEGLNLLG